MLMLTIVWLLNEKSKLDKEDSPTNKHSPTDDQSAIVASVQKAREEEGWIKNTMARTGQKTIERPG